jgi:Sec-independent protein secretion pathway component TatC
VRRTLLPFVVTALALSAAGALLAYAAPGARTFSAAIQLLAH